MAIKKFNNVGIIGAGVAGLSLAVFLKQHGIGSTIYDLRRPGKLPHLGPISLTPNGLRAADAIGLFERLKPHGAARRQMFTMSNDHQLVNEREIGNAEKYGYDALQIYRQAVVDELTEMVHEAGVRIVYEKKFSHVVSDSEDGVTIAFADGDQVIHDLVAGADGIYSAVRKSLFPDLKNTYAGVIAIGAMAPKAAVHVPYPEYPLPAGIQAPHGHIILAPLDANDPVCPIATGYPMAELDRQGWEDLEQDKPRLLKILRHQYDQWNPMVQGALDAVQPDSVFMWPFYSVPALDSWSSSTGRVVILGDAAHGLPPIGALGANLAFEDAYSLGLMVVRANEAHAGAGWTQCLQWWQEYRQKRIAALADMTGKMAKQRQQGGKTQENGEHRQGEQKEAGAQKPGLDNGWVFKLDIAEDVRQWVAA